MTQLTLLSAILFSAAWVFGFVASYNDPAIAGEMEASLMPIVETLLALQNWELFFFIFLNNVLKTFAAAMLGMFFGIIPVIMLLANGFLLGTVHFFSWEAGTGLALAAGVLPHGIFELPAFFLATALGFKLSTVFTKTLFKKEKDLKEGVRNTALFFAKIILPLLFVAAVIEVYITPHIIELALLTG